MNTPFLNRVLATSRRSRRPGKGTKVLGPVSRVHSPPLQAGALRFVETVKELCRSMVTATCFLALCQSSMTCNLYAVTLPREPPLKTFSAFFNARHAGRPFFSIQRLATAITCLHAPARPWSGHEQLCRRTAFRSMLMVTM